MNLDINKSNVWYDKVQSVTHSIFLGDVCVYGNCGRNRNCQTSPESEGAPAVETVERTALNPDTGEEYLIMLPSTRFVKQALLDFAYPPASGIEISEVAEALADQFALADEQRTARGEYGLVWKRHVNIAANTLVNSKQLLRIKLGWITNPKPSEKPGEMSPEVEMERNYRDHRDRLKEELLKKIMENPPDFFEELVLDLLVEMGYGGSRADAEAVGRSGDGGIDGIIKEDKLGLDLIYVQAKREQNNIRIGTVRDFTGALDSKGAQKGIFITTSDFTQGAKDFVEGLTTKRIILIDGKRLVQLMIDHDVGVSLGNFYQLKEVDQDYFAMDETVNDA